MTMRRRHSTTAPSKPSAGVRRPRLVRSSDSLWPAIVVPVRGLDPCRASDRVSGECACESRDHRSHGGTTRSHARSGNSPKSDTHRVSGGRGRGPSQLLAELGHRVSVSEEGIARFYVAPIRLLDAHQISHSLLLHGRAPGRAAASPCRGRRRRTWGLAGADSPSTRQTLGCTGQGFPGPVRGSGTPSAS